MRRRLFRKGGLSQLDLLRLVSQVVGDGFMTKRLAPMNSIEGILPGPLSPTSQATDPEQSHPQSQPMPSDFTTSNATPSERARWRGKAHVSSQTPLITVDSVVFNSLHPEPPNKRWDDQVSFTFIT